MELLRIEQMNKTFGTTPALSDVSLDVRPGEVHALVGENGAGKSTLIKIVTGVYRHDGGRLIWKGQAVTIANPETARRLGISAVHQDRHLIPSFTGYENLYLGLEYPHAGFGVGIRWREMKARAEALVRELDIPLPLSRPASQLSPPQKTMLEIVRVMMRECDLLILDEPTAALTDQEAERLFALIQRLKRRGTSVLYVSHRLDEIFRISDRITVLRNGRNVATAKTGDTNKDELIRWMSDAAVRRDKTERRRAREPLLEVEGLTTADGRVRDVRLAVNKGEIAGIFGLAGAGRTELLEAIYGLRPIRSGRIRLEGKTARIRTPRQALDCGLVLIPEERKRDALISHLSVRENMTLSVLERFRRWFGLDAGRERQAAEQGMSLMQIKATSVDQPVGELSGGNQQKTVFAKALLTAPKVLLCDEPTQAVDVVTREEIHRLLREQADRGNGVLFVSSDLQEMLDVADRVYVLHEGRVTAELDNGGDGLAPEDILRVIFDADQGGDEAG